MKLLHALPVELRGAGPEDHRHSAGPLKEPKELVLRLSVIDSADQLVYTDLRDRKGWRQPLAADEVLNDTRTRDRRESLRAIPAKVVVAHEQAQPGATAEPTRVAQAPYQAGKSMARAQSAMASRQLDARKTIELSSPQAARPVGRSR